MIFVFGSNKAGRHGKGAAKYALENHGAIYGQGEGLQGNSYAIPTKDENLKPISLQGIDMHHQPGDRAGHRHACKFISEVCQIEPRKAFCSDANRLRFGRK